ncbi:hypothetical protein L6164_015758 [Bauhinia variegata]|uniref:Uncharacterized protein n=1 Tax=Bauhinia variegata TaxID=167791 RepID=A0ACB9NM65_BAUVA|nr:hypothetical protein L6164_015758 [Bauhinia variegata]
MFLLFFLYSLFGKTYSSSVFHPNTLYFPSFGPESCSNGQLLCMGSVTAGTGFLSLTPEPQQGNLTLPSSSALNKIGRVLYPQPVHAWPAIISTTFTLRITPFPNSTKSGDGMAFVFAQDDRPSPNASHGSYLGLFDRSTQGGGYRQIAVELDTFMNEFDIDANHVGIDTTSIINPVAAVSLNSTGVDLKSGRDIDVKIEYNGWTNMLHVSVGYSGNQLNNVLNHSIVLSDIIPSSVYVGFTASTGKTSPESHQILKWVFTSVPLPLQTDEHTKHDTINTILIIVIPIFLVALFSSIPFIWEAFRKDNFRRKKEEDIENLSRRAADSPKKFTYKQLSKATCNFSTENLLGSGGFGSVYRGIISDITPKTVAVKKISATSKQGEREFFAEICTIGRLRHKNLVKLQGWCHDGVQLLLVYDYLQNGSLDRFIGKDILDWQTRQQILTGLASALLYLHEECGNPVVHRDVKPSNVMLDIGFKAHLGDFGLARLHKEDSMTSVIAGTPGYMAPEVGFTGKVTPESDVYSFGMVILEVICGRRSKGMMEENSLVDYVWDLHSKNALLQCVDKYLNNRFDFDEEEVKRALKTGLACLHPDPTLRPKMSKVVNIFQNPNEPLMELPVNRPTGLYESLSVTSSASTTDFGSKGIHALLQSSTESLEEISISYHQP